MKRREDHSISYEHIVEQLMGNLTKGVVSLYHNI